MTTTPEQRINQISEILGRGVMRLIAVKALMEEAATRKNKPEGIDTFKHNRSGV